MTSKKEPRDYCHTFGDEWMARTTKMLLMLPVLLFLGGKAAAESPEAKRGKEALLSRPLLPPAWSLAAFQNLWKRCGLPERPGAEAFNSLLREHYGLQAASFPNDG